MAMKVRLFQLYPKNAVDLGGALLQNRAISVSKCHVGEQEPFVAVSGVFQC
jgi:hypothetical protein